MNATRSGVFAAPPLSFGLFPLIFGCFSYAQSEVSSAARRASS
jgi:hypothetical protein